MLRAVTSNELVACVCPAFWASPNRALLVPWRLAAVALHVCGLIAVADFREQLIIHTSLPPVYDQADFVELQSSANWAIAAAICCLFLVSHGFFSGRTTSCELLNFFHALCHTLAGVLLVCVWSFETHIVRVWHIWYFFGFFPAVVETLVSLRSVRQGLACW